MQGRQYIYIVARGNGDWSAVSIEGPAAAAAKDTLIAWTLRFFFSFFFSSMCIYVFVSLAPLSCFHLGLHLLVFLCVLLSIFFLLRLCRHPLQRLFVDSSFAWRCRQTDPMLLRLVSSYFMIRHKNAALQRRRTRRTGQCLRPRAQKKKNEKKEEIKFKKKIEERKKKNKTKKHIG